MSGFSSFFDDDDEAIVEQLEEVEEIDRNGDTKGIERSEDNDAPQENEDLSIIQTTSYDNGDGVQNGDALAQHNEDNIPDDASVEAVTSALVPAPASVSDKPEELPDSQKTLASTINHELDLDEIYIIDIGIYKGPTSISISPQILGLNAEQEREVKRSGLKANSIPMFKSLTQAATNLENFRAREIYPLLIKYDRLRFCHAKKLVEVGEAIENLKALHVSLSELVGEEYEQGKQDFHERLIHVMATVGMGEELVQQKLPEFMARFPTKERVLSDFKVTPVLFRARASTKVVEAAAAHIMKSSEEAVQQAIQNAITTTRSQTLSHINDVIQQMRSSNLDVNTASVKLRKELEELKVKMSTLMNFDGMLRDLLINTEALNTAIETESTEAVTQELTALEKVFKSVKHSHEKELGNIAQGGYMLI